MSRRQPYPSRGRTATHPESIEEPEISLEVTGKAFQKRFLSMTEAAQRYGVHYKLIQALVSDGTLPSIRLSRNAIRISVEELERWEREQMTRKRN